VIFLRSDGGVEKLKLLKALESVVINISEFVEHIINRSLNKK